MQKGWGVVEEAPSTTPSPNIFKETGNVSALWSEIPQKKGHK